MIVLITTRGNGYTLRTLAKGAFGVPIPTFRLTHYERLLRCWSVPRATYVFSDIERLAPWELRLAAGLHRDMTDAGLRCLNDPARAMSRFSLLRSLHLAGINPFNVYRADEQPRPERFPVFVRHEDDHLRASVDLYHGQDELDRALADLVSAGLPLRGMMVVEFCPAPYREGLWAKWGSWRIADAVFVDHVVLDDSWLVKTGDPRKMTDEARQDQRDAFETNRYEVPVGRAFEIGGIEFGRADHADIDGRTVIYEINTNPFLPPLTPGPDPAANEARLNIRKRFSQALEAIDTPAGGRVKITPTSRRRPIRWWRPGFVTPRRP